MPLTLTARNRTAVFFDDPDSDPPTVLALDELRQAAAAYHEATRRTAVLERLWERSSRAQPDRRDADSDRWERQYLQRFAAARSARLRLAALILIAHGRIDYELEMPRMGGDWQPCGIWLDGYAYVVGQNPHEDDAEPFLFAIKGHDLLLQEELVA